LNPDLLLDEAKKKLRKTKSSAGKFEQGKVQAK